MTKMKAKPGTVDYTKVEMTQVVMPQNTNVLGTVFGGEVLSWIDICAAVSAQRHCRKPIVTASFDEVHFLHPIKHGYVVILNSQVNAVFHTSIEVGTTVTAENPYTGERNVAVRALCTFVSLDSDGAPVKCPPLNIQSEEEKIREKEAHSRRKLRLKHKRGQKL